LRHYLTRTHPKNPTTTTTLTPQIHRAIFALRDGEARERSLDPRAHSRARRRSSAGAIKLEHDPEKCAAVFRRDQAQSNNQSATTIQPNLAAL